MSNDGGVISIMKSHVNVKKDKMKKTTILKKKAEDVEPELRPEFIEEVKKIEKEPIIHVKNLRKHFED